VITTFHITVLKKAIPITTGSIFGFFLFVLMADIYHEPVWVKVHSLIWL